MLPEINQTIIPPLVCPAVWDEATQQWIPLQQPLQGSGSVVVSNLPVTQPVSGTVSANGYVWDTDLLDWVPMQQPILNAGSITIPGNVNIGNWPSTYATEITLQSVAGFNIPKYDYVSRGWVGGTFTETWTFKTGGSGGSAVGTIVIVYDDISMSNIITVTKS